MREYIEEMQMRNNKTYEGLKLLRRDTTHTAVSGNNKTYEGLKYVCEGMGCTSRPPKQ